MAMNIFRTSVSANPSKPEDPDNEFPAVKVWKSASLDLVNTLAKVIANFSHFT
jgi:hypothetical protein